jgi:hypothetical protein
VKNKVAAARLAKPANPWSAAWPWAARIRNPVLLKTASRTPGKPMTLRRATLRQYSRGARPMQRGYRTSNRSAVDSVTACGRAERVRAPESSARRSPVDRSAHSGPFAVTKAEAHASQRNREGGSDMLLVRHIPGSGIPRKTGSKTGWQGESQNTSRTGPF